MSTRYTTDAPHLSDAALAQIRTDAHRYVLAGGSIFPSVHDSSRSEHIGNVRELLRPSTSDRFESALTAHAPEHEAHEAIWSAVWALATDTQEAGFLFGACVGLELAALTVGQPAFTARREDVPLSPHDEEETRDEPEPAITRPEALGTILQALVATRPAVVRALESLVAALLEQDAPTGGAQ